MSSGAPDYPSEVGPTNGSYVTWRELNLALEPIKEQGSRIETTVNLLAGHWFESVGAEREKRRSGDSKRFWLTLLGGMLGCAIVTAITILLMR